MTKSLYKSGFVSCIAAFSLVFAAVAARAADVLAGKCADRAYLYDRVPDPCQVDGVLVPNYGEFGYSKVLWRHWPTERPPQEETTEAPAGPTGLPGAELPTPEEEGLRQPAKPGKSKETPGEESTTDTDASPPPPPELGDRPPVPTLPGAADPNAGPPGAVPLIEPSLPRSEPPKIERPQTPELPNPSESLDELFPSPFSPDNKSSEPPANDTSTSNNPRQSRSGSGSKTVRDDRPPSPTGLLVDHFRASPLRRSTLRRGDGRSSDNSVGDELARSSNRRTGNPLRVAGSSSPSVIRTVSHEEVLDDALPTSDAPPILSGGTQENPLRNGAGR